MRPFLLLLAPLLVCGCVCGCAPRDAAQNDPIRGVAASIVAARAFDRAQIAARRGDTDAFEAASADFDRAQGIGQGRNSHWILSNRLNAAGYLLAEEGKTSAEFDRAIALTRQALQEADKWIQSLPPNDPDLPGALFDRASGPRDSHAWALFKRGRLAEAKTQQELVFKELAASGSKQTVSADIPFHMAEIYRALGEGGKARKWYEEALKLGPNAVLDGRIRAGLAAL